jgi:hypothetical protein
MKKILLTVLFILAIFQMVVLATAIDVGDTAINRASTTSDGEYTHINNGNPANATGTLTSVEVWAIADLVDFEPATFIYVSGSEGTTYYTSRDSEAVGAVSSGSKQTFAVTISVTSGDFIGCYFSDGALEKDTSGFTSINYVTGDKVPCTNVRFNNYAAADAISLYATGATPAATTTNIIMGVNF